MTEKTNRYSYSKTQLFWLVALRVTIGWYFLYEGVAKVMTPGWTSYGYLMDSQGWFAPLFKALAQNQALMPVVDALNIYGLILIGLSLVPFLSLITLTERDSLMSDSRNSSFPERILL